MKNVCKEMHEFRNASKLIWNEFLLKYSGGINPSFEFAYDEIEKNLLGCMVFNGLLECVKCYRENFLSSLVIKGLAEREYINVQYGNKDANSNWVWTEPVLKKIETMPIIYFYDLFDWDHYQPINYKYVRAIDPKENQLMLLDFYECTFWSTCFKHT